MPARRRKCTLDRVPTANGRCSRKIPCMGPDGGSLSYAKRGRDGHCRLRSCGSGKIRNPTTGRCNSRKTSNGSMLSLSKRYDDSRRYVDAYNRAAQAQGVAPPTYYDQFDDSLLQNGANRQRLQQGRRVRWRRQAREREQYRKWLQNNGAPRSFLDHIKRAVKGVTGGMFFSTPAPLSQ